MTAWWVARVQCPNKKDLWVGNFEANGRTDAKRRAISFVYEHYPLDTKIISICRGYIDIKFNGPEIPFESIK